MRVKSYAKVNLILKVGPKRGELHDLFSVVAKIKLHDILDIKVTKKPEINVLTANAKIKQSDNLVYRAILLLKEKTKFQQGVSVIIYKNIPLKSGLGGGSSNAATILKYLNKRLDLDLTKEQLIKLAFKLGSDVPAFIEDGHVLVSRKGQKVESINLKLPRYIILLKPEIGVSAKQAYALFDKDNPNPKMISITKMKQQMFVNDLQEPVFKKYPLIRKAFEAIEPFVFKGKLMSGSGSTIFGISDHRKTVIKAYKKLKKNYNFIVLTKFLEDGK
jgi:4-diphosphocytidyl-2-C-methyl-D-erythritol kinase